MLDWAASIPRIELRAAVRPVCCAVDPKAFEIATTPPVDTEYCCTTPPTSNVLAPASDTQSESTAWFPPPGFNVSRRSAQRPPQPVDGGWSGIEVCHWVT